MKALITSALLASLALAGPALAQSQTGMEARSDKAMQQMDKKDKPAKGFRSVVGKVVETRDLTVTGGTAQHRLLKVETPQGKRVVVDLGDNTKLTGMDIQQNDRIYAVGKAARIGGKPVIFARYAGELNPVGASGMQQTGAQ